jgi:hypothetical protein
LPKIIRTLVDRRETSEPFVLPEELRIAYGGDLWFPPSDAQRPHVIGNFVTTVDGVVSYEIAGKSGLGDISGFDESDRFHYGAPPNIGRRRYGGIRYASPDRSGKSLRRRPHMSRSPRHVCALPVGGVEEGGATATLRRFFRFLYAQYKLPGDVALQLVQGRLAADLKPSTRAKHLNLHGQRASPRYDC